MIILSILGILAGLLPFAALFLPLGVLSIRILVSTDTTRLNIVEIVRMLTGESNGILTRLLNSGFLSAVRLWLFAIAISLAACLLAMLVGLALSCFKGKALSFAAAVYILGALGDCAWLYFFPLLGDAAGKSLLYSADSTILWGSWALLALMVLNAGLCVLRRVMEKRKKGLQSARK